LKIYVRKIEGAIKYGQYRDTGRGGNKTKNEAIQNKNKNTTQHKKNPEKMSNMDPTEKPRVNPYVCEG
jgi:hypothetical protein